MSEFFNVLVTSMAQWPSNLSRQLDSIAADSKNARTWINIAIILGSYMLLRPIIVRGFAATQRKGKESKAVLDAGLTKGYGEWDEALVSANALRANKGGFGGEEGVRKRKEEREKKIKAGKEVDETEALLDQLVDYKEGEDGW